MFKKPHHDPYHSHEHIDAFRTRDFRVFHAQPFFASDLYFEIAWNKKHLKKLHNYVENPHKYHEHHHGRDHSELHHYFQEHVLDSIPFHEKILKDHQSRLNFLKTVMSKFTYKRLHRITKRNGGCPDYFAYDKKRKKYFFIIEEPTHEKRHWRALVKDRYKICDVVMLKN